MRIFATNLEWRPDRREGVIARFREVGLTVEPFTATDVLKFEPEFRDTLAQPAGCANWMTHAAILEQVADGSDGHAVVLEDDAVPDPSPDWPLLLDRAGVAMDGAGIAYLQIGYISSYYRLTTRPGILERVRVGMYREDITTLELDRKRSIVLRSSLGGGHAYIVNRDFARRAARLNSPCWTNTDGVYERIASVSGPGFHVPLMARLRHSLVEQETRGTSDRVDSDVDRFDSTL